MTEKDWLIRWVFERDSSLKINGNINLLYSGAVDSFGFMELVQAIEENFNIRFVEDDFTNQENFTIDSLAALISKKRKERSEK